MQIDFKALEAALAPIEALGIFERKFDAGPTSITLRVLLPAEEIEAQKYAASVLADNEDEGGHAAVEYLDKLRIAFLSYSVVAIGDMDFRGVDYVETGEKLDNGTPIKVPKHKAMRDLISRWSRAVLSQVFAHFHALTVDAEKSAEKNIEYEPADIPAEIDRLNNRIEELREQMNQAEASEKTRLSDRLEAVNQVVQQPSDPEPESDEPKMDPEQALPPSQRAPARRAGPIAPATIQGVPEDIEPPPARPPQGPATRVPSSDSSLINMDDDEGLHAAADAEHARLLERRMRQRAPANPDGSALSASGMHSGGVPPHAGAATTAARVEPDYGQPVGTLDGKEVYRMPGQELATPAAKPPANARAVINPPQATDGGARNPRFQPRKKP